MKYTITSKPDESSRDANPGILPGCQATISYMPQQNHTPLWLEIAPDVAERFHVLEVTAGVESLHLHRLDPEAHDVFTTIKLRKWAMRPDMSLSIRVQNVSDEQSHFTAHVHTDPTEWKETP